MVERMKRAGAIIIGKTNTPEFGLGSNTYNDVFGTHAQRLRPDARPSGGSSGGAGVAVALRMLPVADGSDHGGSLRNPAAYNNVFGFRPSLRPGAGARRSTCSTPAWACQGPMARNVADLAMLLSVQAGYDPRVPLSNRQDPAQFAEPLKRDFKGTRIAWAGDFGGHLPFEPGVLDLCQVGAQDFEALGCIVEEAVPDFPIERVWQNWKTLRAWQAGSALKDLLRRSGQARADEAGGAVRGRERPASSRPTTSTTPPSVRTAWYQAVRDVLRALRLSSCCRPARCFRSTPTTDWPKEIAGKTMDTYHRWMEVMIPVTMSSCPALERAGGLQRPRPADGIADRRAEPRRARLPAACPRLRRGDAVGDEAPAAACSAA